MNTDPVYYFFLLLNVAPFAIGAWLLWRLVCLVDTWFSSKEHTIASNAQMIAPDERGLLPVARQAIEAGQLVQEALGLVNPALVRPDERGLLPVSQSLLTSNAAAEQVLALLASHVLNGRPVANVPHSISYAPHVAYRNDVNAIGQEAQALPVAAQPGDFWSLYSAGALPHDGFLMGYGLEDGQAVTADWRQLYSALIGGQAGSGKSTLIRNILAQSALQGGRFVVLDKHYGAGDESLGESLEPLRPLMLCDVASDEKQMVAALRFVADIGQRRLSGQDTDKTPLVLVVDETTALLQRSNVASALTDVLGMISQETRKVGVYALCIGQQFHGDVMDTTVRNSFVSMIATRSRRDVARTMSGNTEFAKMAETLGIGQAVWMRPDGAVTKIAVPNTTQQHVWMVAQQVGAQNGPKTGTAFLTSTPESQADFDFQTNAPEAKGKSTGSQPEVKNLGDATDARIVDLFLSGIDPQQIVQEVYGVKSVGGGRKYQESLSHVYTVMRDYWRSDRGA